MHYNPDPRHTFMVAMLTMSIANTALAVDETELAKQTNNPIASLTSVPIQYNYDQKTGPTHNGKKTTINIQPVLPFSMNADWNIISRTILPIIDQHGALANGAADESGLGDTTQSVFFSPKALTADGWTWGAGPVLLLPTATDKILGTEKWGAGPTAVALKQEHGFTYGGLVNHIWSVAGDQDREDISATYLQPFFVYTTATHTSFGINTESTYNWKAEQWSVPVNVFATQLLKAGKQLFTVQAGVRYWADSPEDSGPEGWGFRTALTLLFPK